MAKKKSPGKFAVGSKVRVRDGIGSPEFPEISIAGWVGTIVEASGKGEDVQCVLEWDEATMQGMPADYVKKCEEGNLYHAMACLPEANLDPA
jgi:hypothetical protein